MAHFYGIVRGQAKTEGTRRGSPNSGIGTVAASWNGAVSVELYVNENGEDCASVRLTPLAWQGRFQDALSRPRQSQGREARR